MRFSMLIPLVLTLVGCAEMITKKYADQWIGHQVDEAVSTYGAPTHVTEISTGKVYEWQRTGASRATASSWGKSTTVNAYTDFCTIRLTTDQLGTVKYISWNGNSC